MGRDDILKDERVFLVIHEFMLKELKLKGNTLLVFARIFGFCKGGGIFFESRAATARFLNVSERSVIRAIGELEADGLIVEVERIAVLPSGTQCYAVGNIPSPTGDNLSGDKKSPPDKLALLKAKRADRLASQGLPDCHLISKRDIKDF